MRSARSAGGLKPALAAMVLFASLLWSTVTLTTWVIVIVVAGAGAVNLMVLGIVFWGPVLGSIAGGVHILASFVLGRVLPLLPRDLAAALLGWGAALGVWGLLTFSGLEASAVVGSVVVATIGAALNFAVVRSRLGRLA